MYSISAGLDIKDSTATRKELTRLADSIWLHCKRAGEQYKITDSALRTEPAVGMAAAAIYKERYQEGYDSLVSYTAY